MMLAPFSRAAERGSIDDLRSGIERPEDFRRFVEGSRAQRGNPDLPDVFARKDGLAPKSSVRLSRPQTGTRPDGTFVPAAIPAFARKSPLNWDLGTAGLPVRKLAAVLGLGFFLIAASMLETPIESAPEPEPLEKAPHPHARPFVRAAEPSPVPTRTRHTPSDSPFIDTRMPVPTWRAISLREQQLIERWHLSRERSLGLASLSEWLDLEGRVEGVDIRLLKAKLLRDA